MTNQLTLRNLAILYARNSISEAGVRQGLEKIAPVVQHKEAGETWYDGNPDNHIVAVQALIGDEITQEDFNKFVKLLD